MAECIAAPIEGNWKLGAQLGSNDECFTYLIAALGLSDQQVTLYNEKDQVAFMNQEAGPFERARWHICSEGMT